jgi:hypothetical protein
MVAKTIYLEDNPTFGATGRGRKMGKYLLFLEVEHTNGLKLKRRIGQLSDKKAAVVQAHKLARERYAMVVNKIDGTSTPAPERSEKTPVPKSPTKRKTKLGEGEILQTVSKDILS